MFPVQGSYHAVACEYMKVRVQPALLLFFHVSNFHPSQSTIFPFLLRTQTVFISLETQLRTVILKQWYNVTLSVGFNYDCNAYIPHYIIMS